MKILISTDKFKGSLTAKEACDAIGKGLKKYDPKIDLILHPMADGGDGSLSVLSQHLSLQKHFVNTVDPLGRKIFTHYFSSTDSCFIELASASGLGLLKKKEQNPLFTSTLGTGIMIADALNKGFRNIYLFLGGSATNDAGMGIASALGYTFFDINKKELSPVGKNLLLVESVRNDKFVDKENTHFTLLCDVINPLYGPQGAAYMYAPQKGANHSQTECLNKGLVKYSQILNKEVGIEVSYQEGMGAAGGVATSLVAFFGAQLQKGFNVLSQLTKLEDRVVECDCVISGEGKLDEQSLQGKVVSGMIDLCKKHDIPISLFVGKNNLPKNIMSSLGISHLLSVMDKEKNLEKAIQNGDKFLHDMAFDFLKLI